MAIFNTINLSRDFLTTNWFYAKFFTNFGCQIETPNEKDWLFSASPMAASQLVGEVDLTKFFRPISNQLSVGSCVANATADSFEAQIAQRKGISPDQVQDISRLFIYWVARNNMDPPRANVDEGTTIRNAFDAMARYGAAPESLWNYDITKVNVRPSILSFREAVKNRISAFYRIDATGDNRIVQIKQALSAGNPTVFGTRLSESFRYVRTEDIINCPNCCWIGRHAMVICGWSDSKQAFKVRNSWGTDWGFGGYCWMSKNYITSSETKDLWVPTI